MQTGNLITSVSSTTEMLATFILVLVAGSLISLISVHLLDRGVNPMRDAVSDYGAREYAWFYRLAAIWMGVAGVLTAVMLGDAMFPKPTLTIMLMLVFAATRTAITIFPTDLEEDEGTSVGRSHTLLAAIAFAAIAIVAGSFPLLVADDPFWNDYLPLLRALGIAVIAAAFWTGLTRRAVLTDYFGLVERIFYLAMFTWFSAVALILLSA
ncbi:MAG: DUF998 domain-containing protein [Solirubrobacterales bacterium]|nr:DUF998 domain-containing protein [Solirubrobacterales bacterium]